MNPTHILRIYKQYGLYYYYPLNRFINITQIKMDGNLIIFPSLGIITSILTYEKDLISLGFANEFIDQQKIIKLDNGDNIEFLRDQLRLYNIRIQAMAELININDYTNQLIINTVKNHLNDKHIDNNYVHEFDHEPTVEDCALSLIKFNTFKYNNRHKTIIEYLLEKDPLFIVNILRKYGLTNYNPDSNAEIYNLITLINIGRRKIIFENFDLIHYLSNFTKDQLIALALFIIPREAYNYIIYPWGKEYLLYGMLTGNFTGNVYNYLIDEERYRELIDIEPYKITAHKYFYEDNDNEVIPYQYLSRINIKQNIIETSVDNIDLELNQYQMVAPFDDKYDKYYYWAGSLPYYNNVLNRGSDIPYPPDLTDMDIETAEQLLSLYTDRELLLYYGTAGINYETREDLILKIYEQYRGPTWRLNHDKCNNDDKHNYLRDLRSEINKDDPVNPTVSYGTLNDSNCYQLEELIEFFRDDDNGDFHFYNPDWEPNYNILREFPAKSMLDLLSILKVSNFNKNITLDDLSNLSNLITELKDVINYGLDKIDLVQQELRDRIQEYNNFNEEQKFYANIYLVWLFLFSMWIRFWKGPGNPYPYETNSPNYCEPPIRDENVKLQLFVHSIIIDKNEMVRNWINKLPLISFDWKSPDKTKIRGSGSLILMIADIQNGKQCQGIAGDELSSGAYSLITRFIPNMDINLIINTYLPYINNIELDIVTRQLSLPRLANDPFYKERYIDLRRPVVQPSFDPSLMSHTRHVD